MSTQHPITPPPELVQQWGNDAYLSDVKHNEEDWAYEQHIATRAAQWGAEQELEACYGWVEGSISTPEAAELRAARRPKPPSLKEQALLALSKLPPNRDCGVAHETIRRALEALPNV